jgi:hypothetical protein
MSVNHHAATEKTTVDEPRTSTQAAAPGTRDGLFEAFVASGRSTDEKTAFERTLSWYGSGAGARVHAVK